MENFIDKAIKLCSFQAFEPEQAITISGHRNVNIDLPYEIQNGIFEPIRFTLNKLPNGLWGYQPESEKIQSILSEFLLEDRKLLISKENQPAPISFFLKVENKLIDLSKKSMRPLPFNPTFKIMRCLNGDYKGANYLVIFYEKNLSQLALFMPIKREFINNYDYREIFNDEVIESLVSTVLNKADPCAYSMSYSLQEFISKNFKDAYSYYFKTFLTDLTTQQRIKTSIYDYSGSNFDEVLKMLLKIESESNEFKDTDNLPNFEIKAYENCIEKMCLNFEFGTKKQIAAVIKVLQENASTLQAI